MSLGTAKPSDGELTMRDFKESPENLKKDAPASARTQSSSPQPERPVNFYRTHGRAFAKVVTLAFLTYQISYWAWLTLETEEIKDRKNREIKSLEEEVRLLEEGRKSHKPGG
ncbi:hypothetical protein H2200_013114 [Cladophialophora chaetospira]|uniref:Uncharacterized protein n=1 Tax=Cladophialophora chaetospira TaxID=386627 RepID=A0AA38WW72_9EURO|nr:hypothetical protein H2200_013114 [Cladophialophora chaetospira]